MHYWSQILLALGLTWWLWSSAWYAHHNNDRNEIQEHVAEFWPCMVEIWNNVSVIAQIIDGEINFHQELDLNGDIKRYDFPQSKFPFSNIYLPYKKSVQSILKEIEDGWCTWEK